MSGVRTDLPSSEVKFAAISETSGGTHTLVAAVSGKKIRVTAIWFTVSSNIGVGFQSNGVDVIEPAYYDTYGGLAWMRGVDGDFFVETVAGETLDIYMTGASTVAGGLNYQEI